MRLSCRCINQKRCIDIYYIKKNTDKHHLQYAADVVTYQQEHDGRTIYNIGGLLNEATWEFRHRRHF